MVTQAERGCRGSESVSGGVRVRVTPQYLSDHSDPDAGRYVFGYRIRIANESDAPLKLLSRHWVIVDAGGERRVVRGEGVVGEQPRLEPGASFEYSSFCPLQTPWGTMEGTYLMTRDDGGLVEVGVSRFYLVAEPARARA